ncbi:DUF6471 domain-containing protein [Thalassobaculum sp.]
MHGIHETERNPANKISRGGFSAASLSNVSWQSVAPSCG